MKLYNVPRNSKIRVISDIFMVDGSTPQVEKNEVLTFLHLDGMYSYCSNSKNELVHLAAFANVEIVE